MNWLPSLRPSGSARYLTYRVIGIALGAVLIIAGIVKAMDIHLFISQIRQYGLMPDDPRIIGSLAWVLIVLELALGAALAVNWRPGIVLPGVTGLFLVFMGALGWAMLKGGVDDCGCFGPAAARSPLQALLEDLILLIAAASAWYLGRFGTHSRHAIKGWVVAAACAAGIVLPMIVTGSLPWTAPAPAPASARMPAGLVLHSPSAGPVDFQSGTTLLAVMSTDCHHCRESVPALNDLVEEAGPAIQVYGVAANRQSEIDHFAEENFTFYPMLPIDEKDLATLLGDDPFPKFLLIHDGAIVAQWSNQLPSSQALIDLAKDIKGA